MKARGFTLLEALVALAILALSLSAGLRAIGATAHSAASLRDTMLADLIAQNRIAELRATGAFPDVGKQRGESVEAGRRFDWVQTVALTNNALFRTVEVQVFDGGSGVPLGSMSAFLARPL